MKHLIYLLAPLALMISACQAPISQIGPGSKKVGTVKIEADPGAPVEVNHEMEIVFVFDDSVSMKPARDLVVAGIQEFVDGFSKNGLVNFRIGVMTVWDSKRYPKNILDPKMPKPHPLGILRPLRDPKNPGSYLDGAPYVTRTTPNFKEVLAVSLNLQLVDIDKGGPEKEELFSPLQALFSKEGLADKRNFDFVKPGSHTIAVLITDADDSTPGLTPAQLRDQIVMGLKKGQADKFSAYAVIVPGINPGKANSCPSTQYLDYDRRATPGLDPQRVVQFVLQSGGTRDENILSICDRNFGKKLADMGKHIANKVIPEVQIQLKYRPVAGKIKQVLYGNRTVDEKYWKYNWDFNMVVISRDLEIEYQAGAKFSIEYDPIPDQKTIK